MITIDGSEGEGGGQVLRYSAALSLLTGEPFTIRNIRGGRAKPGLMRQHVTALEAACAIGGAECSGLTVGARELTFRPGSVTPGDYHFAVGTAGSTGLVLQTVQVPLMLPAERLAQTAAKRMAGYLASDAFAGPYLQDQLLLPFAMAGGGAFTTVKVSEHTRTAAKLIERFSGTGARVSETADGAHLVEFR